MRSIIFFLFASVLLVSCSNYGKKIKVEGTKAEIYYKGDGVTESDAKKTGEYLKKVFITDPNKSGSIQLTKEGDAFTVHFVYDKKIYDSLKANGIDEQFKILGVQTSKEVFDGKKVNIALSSDHFKDYQTFTYDEAFAKSLDAPAPPQETTTVDPVEAAGYDHDTAGGVTFYWKGLTDAESQTIADYIVKNGSFAGGTSQLYMTKEDGRFVIRFPVIESALNDASYMATVAQVSKEIKDNVFANNPFTFVVTNEKLETVKSFPY